MGGSAKLCGQAFNRVDVGYYLYNPAYRRWVIEFAGFAHRAHCCISKDDRYACGLYKHAHDHTLSDGHTIHSLAMKACSPVITLADSILKQPTPGAILVIYEGVYAPKELSPARQQRIADAQKAVAQGKWPATVTDCFYRETMRIFKERNIPFKVAAGEGEAEAMYLVRCGAFDAAWISSNDTDVHFYPCKKPAGEFLRVIFSGIGKSRQGATQQGAPALASTWNEPATTSKESYARPKGYWRRLVAHVLCGCDFFRHRSKLITGTLKALSKHHEQEPISLLRACVSKEEFVPALEAVLAFALHVVDAPTDDGRLLRVNFIRLDLNEVVDGVCIRDVWQQAEELLPPDSIIRKLPIASSPQPHSVPTADDVIATYSKIDCSPCFDRPGTAALHQSAKVIAAKAPPDASFKEITGAAPAPGLPIHVITPFFGNRAVENGFQRAVVLSRQHTPNLSWSDQRVASRDTGDCWLRAHIPSQIRDNGHPVLLRCEYGLLPYDGGQAFFITKLLGTHCDCVVANCGECAHVVGHLLCPLLLCSFRSLTNFFFVMGRLLPHFCLRLLQARDCY